MSLGKHTWTHAKCCMVRWVIESFEINRDDQKETAHALVEIDVCMQEPCKKNVLMTFIPTNLTSLFFLLPVGLCGRSFLPNLPRKLRINVWKKLKSRPLEITGVFPGSVAFRSWTLNGSIN